jgi:copper chaperone CopZ
MWRNNQNNPLIFRVVQTTMQRSGIMKTKISIFAGFLLLAAFTAVAQDGKTERFEVKGLCALCKNRIETAAMAVAGVIAADWNQETKILEVSFDAQKTGVDAIQKAIADVGHDTPMYKALDAVYDKLPDCCKYERTVSQENEEAPETHHH